MLQIISIFFACAITIVHSHNPILLMPGLTGSLLEAKLHNAHMPHKCPSTEDWFKVWVDVTELYLKRKCWDATMTLKTSVDGYSYENPGVVVRALQNTSKAIYCLDPANGLICDASMYMGKFLDFLEKKGYMLEHNLDAVPYDWRLSPLNHYAPDGLFERLKLRIEKMNRDTGKKVVVLGHSMGCAYTNLFLNTYVKQAWKDKFINSFISVSGVYAGSVKALGAVLNGDSGTVPYKREWIQPVQATFAGVHALIPSNSKEKAYWGNKDVLYKVGSKSYNVNQIRELYTKMGVPPNIIANIDKLRGLPFQAPPRVKVHCVYGYKIKTIMQVKIKSLSKDDRYNPDFIYGPGDGTVPARSLEICTQWAKRQNQTATTKLINASHLEIISKTDETWEYIFNTVNSNE